MTKVIVALKKRADMDAAAFHRYWRDVHGPIGASMPGLRRYIQNRVLGDNVPFDGIAEMWFDDAASLQAAFTSPAAVAAAQDVPNFLESTQVLMVEEEMVVG